ncbi:YceI family protein [Paraliomyxa miuraensis]|uniref:YceI family protein n=1 Tax=Paraliomyxa miuraensis TaxID=376150 RepID=UPI0022567214|nr:YceI family protein [Paraliomyxa miuraensis]MCX4243545.1 YceI family protein [Paraliomyxa miuraensis]
MRRTFLALTLCSSVSLAACQSQLDDKPKAEVKDAKATPDSKTDSKPDSKTDAKGDAPDGKAMAHASTIAKLDKASSSVGFVGAKVTADHEGSFADFDGSLTLGDDGKATGLEITVKVDSLTTDAPDLTKHLLTADFFDAPSFPESKFVSTAITEKAGDNGATHEIEGNLTLHGQTKSITFPAKVEVTDALAKGSAEFKIDRTLWGIVYPGMKDDLIKDEVLLQLNLSFPRG